MTEYRMAAVLPTQNNFLIVERLVPTAKLPEKAHYGDLGYDLFALTDYTILEGHVGIVPTGIRVQFPDGYGAKIFDRSSVATKQNLFVVAGVIDNKYTGEIKVAIYSPNYDATILAGTKIAQMVLLPVVNVRMIEGVVSSFEAARGAQGFGSTGS